MPEINWTSSQRRAIDTVDGHVMVTAAAGSGKTAVLAERCAHLVADLPKERRVHLDQLLVVTFTEAAAAEMRHRIGRFIRDRIDADPRDGHLAQQLVQLDAAAISTLHAFCLHTLRRWFTHADVDPTATLLDEGEADVLRRDVLAGVLKRHYAGAGSEGDAFRRFVRDYADGHDDGVSQIVLQLYGFLQSLVDPDDWCHAAESPPPSVTELTELHQSRMAEELSMLAKWANEIAARFIERGKLGRFYADRFANSAEFLKGVGARLRNGADWEPVRDLLRTFKPQTLHGKKNLIVSREDEAFDQLGDRLYKKFRTTMFKEHIVERYGAFDAQAAVADLARVGEPKSVLLALVRDFNRAYAQAKRDAQQLDFIDLERMTLRLLTGEDPAARDDLRRRFRFVLVDEFQDINPVQSAILDAISPPHPDGNLFVVGDIKQSIYRFRLAAPEIFRDRLTTLEGDPAAGACIPLQENFRSRPSLLEALNLIFRRTMVPGFGRMRYESHDELRAPVETPYQASPHDDPPIECHLLDKIASPAAADDDVDDDEGDETKVGDREAHLIARRIQDLVGRFSVLDRDPDNPDQIQPRPAEYRDVCILLRAAKGRAEKIKQVLEAQDIPVVAESTTGFFEATEIRDILALLHLMDNGRQDIPLAAVLRSPLFGDPFDETALAKLRVSNKSVPFHQAVFEYAKKGNDGDLRGRVEAVVGRLADYRHRLRHHCLADVLWQIYKRDGYLAYVGGLRDGRLRRGNLLALHERARAFSAFTRQGLRRFLRYIDRLREADRDFGAASVSADQNVVRISTIHKSKGLEFPIVILAHAGQAFNEQGSRGSILVDRHVGLGVKVVDPDAKIEYPTVDHHRAADRIRLDNRAEELRLLYVAATRAKEKLIIVGTCPLEALDQNDLQFRGWSGPLPDLTLQSAGSYLDWILPCLAADGDRVKTAKGRAADRALFDLRTYTAEDLAEWPVEPAGKKRDMHLFQRMAALDSLPRNEPRKASPLVDSLFRRLQFQYPAEALVALPAVVAAGEIKRRLDLLVEPDESAHRIRPASAARQPEDARRRGIATHLFHQLIDLTSSCDLDTLSRMRDRFVEDRRVAAEDADLIDLDGAAWFLATDWGQRLRTGAETVHREAMFTIAQPASLIAPHVESSDPDDTLLIRGIIDVLLVTPDGLEILDYKTDQIAPEQAAERADAYRTQLDIYTTAAQTIWKRPVRSRALVFLAARTIISD
jgi:ATP-dependent helicase/nuclease subunit A